MQTLAITPMAIPAFFPPLIPPEETPPPDLRLPASPPLASSATSGAGAGDGDFFVSVELVPGTGAGEDSGAKSEGGGAGGEFREGEGDGSGEGDVEFEGGAAGPSAPTSGAGLGEVAGGSAEKEGGAFNSNMRKKSVKMWDADIVDKNFWLFLLRRSAKSGSKKV